MLWLIGESECNMLLFHLFCTRQGINYFCVVLTLSDVCLYFSAILAVWTIFSCFLFIFSMQTEWSSMGYKWESRATKPGDPARLTRQLFGLPGAELRLQPGDSALPEEPAGDSHTQWVHVAHASRQQQLWVKQHQLAVLSNLTTIVFSSTFVCSM